MVKITKSYVAGLLESKGGFYLYKGSSKKQQYLGFKMVGYKSDKLLSIIVDYFRKNNVLFRFYNIGDDKIVYCLGHINGLKKFINFMKKNCYRDDYNEFKYTKEKGWAIK